jgi:transglutaminase-like putative cysteine protease
MDRRGLLKSIGMLPAAAAATAIPGVVHTAFAANDSTAAWRTFEITTRVEILNPEGKTRVWLPMPLVAKTDYQHNLGYEKWNGNGSSARVDELPHYGTDLLHAEWSIDDPKPQLELTSRAATRDRVVDFNKPSNPHPESEATLDFYRRPTAHIPTDGPVKATADKIVRGYHGDMDKARAIYEWIVVNTFRDPKVRGCGTGNILFMLESGDLGGKCADLNALFVGLARAAGIPARDVYGVRVAPSKTFHCLGTHGPDCTKAQHCRAEFYHADYGWIPVDPADVRKVVLEEKPGLNLQSRIVQRARAKLFGGWEMNWLALSYAQDVTLPGATRGPINFVMYPQCETGSARVDSLDPKHFRYTITSREITA